MGILVGVGVRVGVGIVMVKLAELFGIRTGFGFPLIASWAKSIYFPGER